MALVAKRVAEFGLDVLLFITIVFIIIIIIILYLLYYVQILLCSTLAMQSWLD